MTMMRAYSSFQLAAVVILSTLLFTACSSTPAASPSPAPAQQELPGVANQKKGDTILTGQLTLRGSKYFLEQTGKQPQEIESYAVELSEYVDKTVTITGQFSGDTLFAGTIATQ